MVHSFGHEASAPAQLVQLARDLEPTVASGLFLQIAEDYLRAGHCDLAANVLLQLLEQFPDEPAAARPPSPSHPGSLLDAEPSLRHARRLKLLHYLVDGEASRRR